jgi:hypothetical protein
MFHVGVIRFPEMLLSCPLGPILFFVLMSLFVPVCHGHGCFLMPLLYQVKAKEYKYPNQVNKVPVQSGFFNHEVMSPFLEHIFLCHYQHDRIDNNTGKYMEAM